MTRIIKFSPLAPLVLENVGCPWSGAAPEVRTFSEGWFWLRENGFWLVILTNLWVRVWRSLTSRSKNTSKNLSTLASGAREFEFSFGLERAESMDFLTGWFKLSEAWFRFAPLMNLLGRTCSTLAFKVTKIPKKFFTWASGIAKLWVIFRQWAHQSIALVNRYLAECCLC